MAAGALIPKVAITGVGVVCAAGRDRHEFWHNVSAGGSYLRPAQRLDVEPICETVVGEVRDLDPERVRALPGGPPADRASLFAVLAALEAVEQSSLDVAALERSAFGVGIGTGQGGLVNPGLIDENDPPSIDTIHAISDAVARRFGAAGPRASIVTACTSGANAIGWARDQITTGAARVMLAGGAEVLSLIAVSGFGSCLVLSRRACAPYTASEGLSLGEGAAMLVLEDHEHARARGAVILAELLGCGLSADAFHPTSPDPSGGGAAHAVHRGLRQCGLTVADVDYVNGHGTATAANDAMERRLVRTTFAGAVPISSTKGAIGHTLGAAGAIDAVTCVLAIQAGEIPPTTNVARSDPGIDIVPSCSRPASLDVVVSNNHAFGGNNSSLVIARAGRGHDAAPADPCAVVLSGVGVMGPPGREIDAWWEAFDGTAPVEPLEDTESTADGPTDNLAAPKVWRRMDRVARRSLVAARSAAADARLRLPAADPTSVGLLFATHAGPTETMEAFVRSIGGRASLINPMLFANTIVHAPAGHLCLAMGLRGPTSTYASGGVSALLALDHAFRLVQQGEVDTVLVVAAELVTPAMIQIFRHHGIDVDVIPSASRRWLASVSVALVVEREEAAVGRGVTPRGRMLGSGVAGAVDPIASPEVPAAAATAALSSAAVDAGTIDVWIAATGGSRDGPAAAAEDAAQRSVLPHVAVRRPKAVIGETLGASGAVGVLAAIHGFERQRSTRAVVNAFAAESCYASVVLERVGTRS